MSSSISALRDAILVLDARYEIVGSAVVGTIDGRRIEIRLDEASGTFRLLRVGPPHSFEAGGVRNVLARMRNQRTALPLIRLLQGHGWTRAR